MCSSVVQEANSSLSFSFLSLCVYICVCLCVSVLHSFYMLHSAHDIGGLLSFSVLFI